MDYSKHHHDPKECADEDCQVGCDEVAWRTQCYCREARGLDTVTVDRIVELAKETMDGDMKLLADEVERLRGENELLRCPAPERLAEYLKWVNGKAVFAAIHGCEEPEDSGFVAIHKWLEALSHKQSEKR